MEKENGEILDAGIQEFAIKLFLHISYDYKDDLSNLPIIDLDPNIKEIIIGVTYYLKADKYLKLRAAYKEKTKWFEKIKLKKTDLIVPDALHLLKNGGIWNFFDTIIYVTEPNEDELEQYKIPLVDDIGALKKLKRDELQHIINYKYISAERNSMNPSKRHGKSTILSTLAAKYWAVSLAAQENEEITENKMDLEAQLLLADDDLTTMYSSVFQQILDQLTTLSDSKDKLKIISSFQVQNLLSENATVIFEHGTTKLPEYYNGLGYMNLIEILFKLSLIKRQFEEYAEGHGADVNLLFIEEPEAHMHPQMQVIFIKKHR
jgi:predicted ATP-dependent endonuclease of OLD family